MIFHHFKSEMKAYDPSAFEIQDLYPLAGVIIIVVYILSAL